MTLAPSHSHRIIAGTALFQGGLLAIRYIERHEMQEVIAIANGIELTRE